MICIKVCYADFAVIRFSCFADAAFSHARSANVAATDRFPLKPPFERATERLEHR
jgi:hypothetical protein